MKSLKLIAALTLILCVFSFAACSNDDKTQSPQAPSSSQNNMEIEENSSASSENENTKYGDAKVYEKDGVPHAKTEEGEEVELSGESLMELMAEYEKVKGSGSEKEKELLDKIQLILEAPKK